MVSYRGGSDFIGDGTNYTSISSHWNLISSLLREMLNGIEDLRYNPRFRKPPIADPEERHHDTVRKAIFGRKADQYLPEYVMFRQTGEIAPRLSKGYRERMRAVSTTY